MSNKFEPLSLDRREVICGGGAISLALSQRG